MNFDYMAKYIDTLPSIGVPMADCVVSYKGENVFRRSSGYFDVKNKIPVKQDSLYNLYSASKVITVTAAMMLYERGAFLLEDSIAKYIPEFKNMYVKVENADGEISYVPAKREISIHDLFTMSAGLTYDLCSDSIKNMQKKTDGRCPTVETVRAIANEPLIFHPGEHYNYSLCHDVLGALIEICSGMKFGDFLKENIFEPLGMENTGFDVNDDIFNRMSCQYIWENDSAVEITKDNPYRLGTEYQSGGAGLVSCADDYIKFAQCLANGGNTKDGKNLISRATIDLMRQNHMDYVRRKEFKSIAFGEYTYGLGVRTMDTKNCSTSNGSVGEFGWDGAAAAFVLIDPERELAMYYASHIRNYPGRDVHRRLRNMLYAALEK